MQKNPEFSKVKYRGPPSNPNPNPNPNHVICCHTCHQYQKMTTSLNLSVLTDDLQLASEAIPAESDNGTNPLPVSDTAKVVAGEMTKQT